MSTEVDIQQFINEAQSEVPSDQRVITPEGEFSMYVRPGSTKMYEGVSEKDGKPWKLYTALAVIDAPEVRSATNLEEPTARIRFMLDVNEKGNLVIGTNRNLQLGRLLKATGQDKPGWTYGSIEGVPFKGRVAHVADKKDANRVDAEVRAFAKL